MDEEGKNKMTDLVKKAYEFAKAKHAGQKYAEHDYFDYHICGVVNMLDDSVSDECKVIAYLHDTFEDTDTTYPELAQAFGSIIARAIAVLTKSNDESYEQYIIDILNDRDDEVIAVKLADLNFNIHQPTDKQIVRYEKERIEKYKLARYILENC
jgi:(p)ppGpp synthase/HD superfamily hydrolase